MTRLVRSFLDSVTFVSLVDLIQFIRLYDLENMKQSGQPLDGGLLIDPDERKVVFAVLDSFR